MNKKGQTTSLDIIKGLIQQQLEKRFQNSLSNIASLCVAFKDDPGCNGCKAGGTRSGSDDSMIILEDSNVAGEKYESLILVNDDCPGDLHFSDESESESSELLTNSSLEQENDFSFPSRNLFTVRTHKYDDICVPKYCSTSKSDSGKVSNPLGVQSRGNDHFKPSQVAPGINQTNSSSIFFLNEETSIPNPEISPCTQNREPFDDDVTVHCPSAPSIYLRQSNDDLGGIHIIGGGPVTVGEQYAPTDCGHQYAGVIEGDEDALISHNHQNIETFSCGMHRGPQYESNGQLFFDCASSFDLCEAHWENRGISRSGCSLAHSCSHDDASSYHSRGCRNYFVHNPYPNHCWARNCDPTEQSTYPSSCYGNSFSPLTEVDSSYTTPGLQYWGEAQYGVDPGRPWTSMSPEGNTGHKVWPNIPSGVTMDTSEKQPTASVSWTTLLNRLDSGYPLQDRNPESSCHPGYIPSPCSTMGPIIPPCPHIESTYTMLNTPIREEVTCCGNSHGSVMSTQLDITCFDVPTPNFGETSDPKSPLNLNTQDQLVLVNNGDPEVKIIEHPTGIKSEIQVFRSCGLLGDREINPRCIDFGCDGEPSELIQQKMNDLLSPIALPEKLDGLVKKSHEIHPPKLFYSMQRTVVKDFEDDVCISRREKVEVQTVLKQLVFDPEEIDKYQETMRNAQNLQQVEEVKGLLPTTKHLAAGGLDNKDWLGLKIPSKKAAQERFRAGHICPSFSSHKMGNTG